MSEPHAQDNFSPDDRPVAPSPEETYAPSAPTPPEPSLPRDPWEMYDAVRDAFGPRGRGRGPRGYHPYGPHGRGHGGSRAGRGDIRSAVLLLLSEGEMHGYQIIREIDERSRGTWKPSPGSVYPTLQMLADEGLVEASETGGRKTYRLTDAGRDAANKAAERPAPWKTPGTEAVGKASALPRAGAELAQAVSQIATSGTPEQNEAAIKVLKDARRQIYGILAQE